MENGPFEDDFPIEMGIFHCYVSLPKGIAVQIVAILIWKMLRYTYSPDSLCPGWSPGFSPRNEQENHLNHTPPLFVFQPLNVPRVVFNGNWSITRVTPLICSHWQSVRVANSRDSTPLSQLRTGGPQKINQNHGFEKGILGGGFKMIFYFHPYFWGRWTHFDSYFSDGLKPPTSIQYTSF